ncbi:hypothetical protein [uncultured Anaerococcus sp.]|uniref:hypothetical protein n=1 Tax=uncultured Anaerococcus sp. TaxID=293428 RepID=UPI002613AD61|nr:hypothetical protein [uncultured Anaerococcus sp.]
MGKLIGQTFKEDFKSIILWLLLPIASALIFLQLLDVFRDSPLLGIGMSISMTMITIGPLIALGIAAKNDYERFYGKNAAFYSALPLSSSAINGARLVGFILVGLMIAIATFINYIILILFSSNLSIGELFDAMSNSLVQIDASTIFAAILLVFSIGLYLVSIIMLANTAGASSLFGKKSKYAPVILFLILFFGLGMLTARIQGSALNEYMASSYITESIEAGIVTNLPFKVMAVPMMINVLISLVLYGLTYYFHDKKLSVN